MKKYTVILTSFLMFSLMSCDRNDSILSFTASDITVTVPVSKTTSAVAAVFAEDVTALEVFTIGVCYSTDPEPTTVDDHIEKEVNADTLLISNLTLNFNLEDLTKGTGYYIKAYIRTAEEIFYSEPVEFTTQINTLNIEVSDDYIPEGRESWVVLSENSTVLLTQKLENGKTYSFSDNIPDNADFHVFQLFTANNKVNLYCNSYADIVPDDFYLDQPLVSPPQIGLGTITISDLSNFLRWGVSGTWWNTSTVSPTGKSLTAFGSKEPDDLFIYYLPSDGSAPRYKIISSVYPGYNASITMNDFAPMTSFAEIALPENSSFYYALGGFDTDYYTEYTRYYYNYNSSGYPGPFRLYYPTAFKDNFYLYAYYNTTNTQSFLQTAGQLPSTYFKPFPAITIQNDALLKTVTSGVESFQDYEMVDFAGTYSDASYYILWNYYRETKATNVTDLPEFPAEISARINYMTINDISFSDVGYIDIENSPVTDYSSYVDLIVKQSSRFVDVIKERRHYYQWSAKKSAEHESGIRDLNEGGSAEAVVR